ETVSSGASLVGEAMIRAARAAMPNEVMLVFDEIRASGGIFEYIKGLLSSTLTDVFNALGGDRSNSLANLVAVVQGIVESSDQILAGLQTNDCAPLFNALSQLGDALGQVAGDAWEGLVE